VCPAPKLIAFATGAVVEEPVIVLSLDRNVRNGKSVPSAVRTHAMNDQEPVSNLSRNPHFDDLVAQGPARRRFLKQAAAAVVVAGSPLAIRAPWNTAHALPPTDAAVGALTFKSVPVSTADAVVVPPGYTARVIYAWGDPVTTGPAFSQAGLNTAVEQEQQAGMHHDGMHFFPFAENGRAGVGRLSSTHGLLVVNHEYVDSGLLFPDGQATWTAEKVKKAQAAHGVSVVEIRRDGGAWTVVRPSKYGRRVTAYTPIMLSGPAAGHPLMRTAADSSGTYALGTVNNCANGFTPWGTYLTCEENFNGYFLNKSGRIPADQSRYGITANDAGYRWSERDSRFDAALHPNEPNRFGWVVEIDPWDPQSTPVKRTALGRMKHEGATPALAADGRLVIYMGDDERFEYVYKFVTRDKYQPGSRESNRDLLDNGTLYVARFDGNGTGTWLPLVHGRGALTAANGFASQAEVCIRTRQAADAVGATKMDRPEWIAVNPLDNDVYVTLTNNMQRGMSGRPGVDAANPRVNNVFGHVLRWSEQGSDAAATAFAWNIFALCGDPANTDPNKQGNLKGDAFGSPDGLLFDQRGVLWIQTDVSTSAINVGDYGKLGNNQMIAANPKTGETKRFLTGPKGCEVTGIAITPDHKTMFINIQHPGEPSNETTNPATPTAISTWPDGSSAGRPRAATVAITRDDGGLIGT
jgi:uncharacterized protein